MKFFTRHRRKARVAVDIGSDSLKTIVFEIPRDGGVARGVRKIITKLNPESDAARIISSLHEVVFSIIKQLEDTPESIVVGLGPNIADASLQTLTVPLETGTRVASAADLKKAFGAAFDRSRLPGQAVLAYPIDILGNGYIVSSEDLIRTPPHIVKEIGFNTVLFSFAHETSNAMIELRQMFGGMPVEFVPSVVAVREAIVDALQTPDTFLIDVGGSHTLLLFIKDKRLAQFSYFPVGAHQFSQKLSAERQESFADSEDLKSQYIKGFVNESEIRMIRHIFGQVSNEWKTAFLHELDAFYPCGPLPEYIFLTGGGSYIPEVRSAIYAPEISKNFSHARALKIKILKGPAFFQGDSLGGMLQGPEDANVAALVHYSIYHKPLF